ncbi:MAG: adenosine deaminase [Thermodesulfobacteriota bacterium]|jgi:adenosine deaminase|nr:MAG: adenosine deaminase [Thermodesulfobacteriota bacterium]
MVIKDLHKKMKEFPKVDLHRHLEGSIRVESFLDIARKEKVKLPTYDLEAFRRLVQVNDEPPDFINFLNKFKVARGFYPNRNSIERVAYEAVEDAARDNVKYLELRYSPTHFASVQRFPEEEVIRWVQGAFERAMGNYDIEVIPVLTISRNYGIELAEHTVNIAVKLAGKYFFGLDLAGDEINYPAKPMAPLFRRAQDAGMGLTLHAGEAGGPENIIEAVEKFGCDRIGHGVQAAKSEQAMTILKKTQTLLEMCPTSNIHTGVVRSLKAHPLKMFYERGLSVSLNTDDPMVSNITLTDEYVNAVTKMGFNEDDLKKLNIMAIEHCFHPNKETLKKKFAKIWNKGKEIKATRV